MDNDVKETVNDIDNKVFGNESEIFSQKEIQDLDLVRETRKKIINSMVADGIPDNPKSIRLLNEVLTAHESSINSRAGTRLKKQEIQQAEMAKDQIVQILKNVRTSGEFIDVTHEASQSPTELRAPKSIPLELVPGQTSLVKDSDIAEEFLAKYEGGNK